MLLVFKSAELANQILEYVHQNNLFTQTSNTFKGGEFNGQPFYFPSTDKTNRNVSFIVEGSRVEIAGSRCPLLLDYPIISFAHKAKLKPLVYNTTTPHLKYWQTVGDWLSNANVGTKVRYWLQKRDVIKPEGVTAKGLAFPLEHLQIAREVAAMSPSEQMAQYSPGELDHFSHILDMAEYAVE
jgi:hypothetical protein